MEIYKLEQVENLTMLHKNEKEIRKDVKSAIHDGWILLGDTMFGYQKNYLDIPHRNLENFIKEFGNDFDFIKTENEYKVLYTKFTRVVPEAKDLIRDIFSI
jgi:lysyl-tRNA synthetase class I